MSDSEMVVLLHDMARKEETTQNLRVAQAIYEIADRLAELTKKVDT
jgi:hypothetical protein